MSQQPILTLPSQFQKILPTPSTPWPLTLLTPRRLCWIAPVSLNCFCQQWAMLMSIIQNNILQNLIYIQYVPPAWFSHAWQRVCFFLPADCESYDSDSWLRACRFRAKLVLDLLAWQGLNRESRYNRLWMDGRCNFALSTVTLINNVKCYFSTGSSSHMERKITTVSLNTVYWDKTKL